MRKFRHPALALAALAAFAAAAGAQALYSPPEGDFSIAFPSAPSVQSKPANRSKDIASRRYVDEERGRVMVVSIEDYPDGDLPAAADGGVYDHLLRSLAENRNGQLISTRAERLSGRPCLEGQIMDPNGEIEIVRVLMIGDRIYQLTYALPEGADANGADAAFFGSFRITKTP
jgi:hypothetical protein